MCGCFRLGGSRGGDRISARSTRSPAPGRFAGPSPGEGGVCSPACCRPTGYRPGWRLPSTAPEAASLDPHAPGTNRPPHHAPRPGCPASLVGAHRVLAPRHWGHWRELDSAPRPPASAIGHPLATCARRSVGGTSGTQPVQCAPRHLGGRLRVGLARPSEQRPPHQQQVRGRGCLGGVRSTAVVTPHTPSWRPPRPRRVPGRTRTLSGRSRPRRWWPADRPGSRSPCARSGSTRP